MQRRGGVYPALRKLRNLQAIINPSIPLGVKLARSSKKVRSIRWRKKRAEPLTASIPHLPASRLDTHPEGLLAIGHILSLTSTSPQDRFALERPWLDVDDDG